MRPDDQVSLGVVIKPHGLQGEVKVRAYTGNLKAFTAYEWFDTRLGRLKVLSSHVQVDVIRLKLEGIHSIEAAEKIRGLELVRPRSEIRGTGLISDYLGREVRHRDPASPVIGRIEDYFEAPQSGLFRVVFQAGHERMIPSTLEYWEPLADEGPAVLLDPGGEWSGPL